MNGREALTFTLRNNDVLHFVGAETQAYQQACSVFNPFHSPHV